MIAAAVIGLAMMGPVPYPQAYQDHVDHDRPLVVLVGAEWCAPCQGMKRRLEKMSLRFSYVDVDKQTELANKIRRGRSIPQLVVYTGDHKEPVVRRIYGFHSEAMIRSVVPEERPAGWGK